MQKMQTNEKACPMGTDSVDLIETLIAISVVARRLAQKLNQESISKEEKNYV